MTGRGTGGVSVVVPSARQVDLIARLCGAQAQSYADHVMLIAYLAARTSEVAGLVVGDVDWESTVVTIGRQCFPGVGGLIVKPTKGRRARRVPILGPIEPTLRRLTADRPPGAPLLRGPRGGVITTASLRRATQWDSMVARLGLPGLRRHDLRHAGATWLADSGAPLHVVSEILGHGSIETTRAYLHVDETALRRAAEQINTYLGSPS
jgi:integrase